MTKLEELKAAAADACIAHNVALDARWIAMGHGRGMFEAIAAADDTLVTYTLAYRDYQDELKKTKKDREDYKDEQQFFNQG